MRLLTFRHEGREKFGCLDGNEVVDISGVSGVPSSLLEMLRAGDDGRAAVAGALSAAPRLPLGDIDFLWIAVTLSFSPLTPSPIEKSRESLLSHSRATFPIDRD